MKRWEYCVVQTDLKPVQEKRRIFYFSRKKVVALIRYFQPDNSFRVETVETDFSHEDGAEGEQYRTLAIGYTLAKLGDLGWELVTYDLANQTAMLKRAVPTAI